MQNSMMQNHPYCNLNLFFSFVVAVIFLLLCCATPAYAHRPHDVVTQVELSSHYSQDQTLFILVRDNLFKSTDRGNSWQRIVNGLDSQSGFSQLSIAQTNPEILFLASEGDGIYKSSNKGQSWQKINTGLADLTIDQVLVSPFNPEIVFAADQTGQIYKSTNGGQNWVRSQGFEHKITAIDFSKTDSDRLLLGTENGQLFLTENGGISWVERSISPQSAISSITAIEAILNGNTAETWMVGTQGYGIFQTIDSGTSWTKQSEGLPSEVVLDLEASRDAQGSLQILTSTWQSGFFQLEGNTWKKHAEGLQKDRQADQMKQPHFSDLEIANDPDILTNTLFLAGFDGLFRSEDGGKTWVSLETLARGTVVAFGISPNYANDSTIAVVTYVGNAYLSQDQGETWKPINRGIEIARLTNSFQAVTPNQDPRRFFDTVFSPTYGADHTIFASLLWTKFLRTENEGKNWKIAPMPQEIRGLSIAASPNFKQDRTVYISDQQGIIYRSINGGKSFTQIAKIPALQGNYGPSIVLSPNFREDQTVFVSGEMGIYQSVDGGKTWKALTENTPLANKGKIQIVISPNYAADKTLIVSTISGLFQTQDAGKTWSEIQGILPDLSTPDVEGVTISPNYQNDRTFIISVRGKGLFKTTNNGQTFESIGDPSLPFARLNNVPSSGLPLQFSPNYAKDQTLYGFGAANTALFKSIDGGQTWKTLTIPVYKDQPYDLVTTLDLWFYINGSRILKIVALLAFLGMSYGILSILALAERPWLLRVWKFLIAIVLALGIFFRFANLDQKVYSADEVRSILRLSGYTSQAFEDQVFTGKIVTTEEIQYYQKPNSSRGLGDALNALAGNPEHPPLYHLITRFWMQLFPNLSSARIISILIEFLALPCLYWLCLELFQSQLVAWVMVLLVVVSPFHIMASQNTTQYSLWTVMIALSSTLFLQALRKETWRDWTYYSLAIAAGFYTHLFFAIVSFGHGLVILFSKSWRHILAFLIASFSAVLLFVPWLIVIFTNLDKIERNTRYYRQFDNNLKQIISRFIYNLGNVFLDFHNKTRLENYFDLALACVVLYALYFLWTQANPRSRIFILTLILVTPIVQAVPDLISPSIRSLQARYYLPSFLGIELTIAFLIAGSMQLVMQRGWQQQLGQLALVSLLSCGIVSGVFVTQINDWGIDDQQGTASGLNLQIAPKINKADRPLVISDATPSFVLALSYLVKDSVQFQLFHEKDPNEWQAHLDLPDVMSQFSDVFIYFPNPDFVEFISQTSGLKPKLLISKGSRKLLYQLTEGGVEEALGDENAENN
jgi:uncharacterized membrane protein/photosystem II stability/assembly factor-like uncharacterized protein